MSGVKIAIHAEVSAALMYPFMSTKRTRIAISMMESHHDGPVCICTCWSRF